MSRLIVAAFLMLAVGCKERAEEGLPAPADVDTVIGPEGGEVATRDSKACILVPAQSDSMRVTITQRRPWRGERDPVPIHLPRAFVAADSAKRRVFGPMYDFSVKDRSGEDQSWRDITSFPGGISVAICIEHGDLGPDDLILAHPDPADPGTLEDFDWETPQCSIRCKDDPRSARRADRWLAGSPVTPGPAHANPAEYGLGGKGPGPSPIAAVLRRAPGDTISRPVQDTIR